MFHKENPEYNRRQVVFYTLDELVLKDRFLRKVEETIDFSFLLFMMLLRIVSLQIMVALV